VEGRLLVLRQQEQALADAEAAEAAQQAERAKAAEIKRNLEQAERHKCVGDFVGSGGAAVSSGASGGSVWKIKRRRIGNPLPKFFGVPEQTPAQKKTQTKTKANNKHWAGWSKQVQVWDKAEAAAKECKAASAPTQEQQAGRSAAAGDEKTAKQPAEQLQEELAVCMNKSNYPLAVLHELEELRVTKQRTLA
jgi:hypothetical protein